MKTKTHARTNTVDNALGSPLPENAQMASFHNPGWLERPPPSQPRGKQRGCNKSKSGWRAPIDIWYNQKYKDLFLDIFSSVEKNNNLIDWSKIIKFVYETDRWPGKHMHQYLSLAILSNKYQINI